MSLTFHGIGKEVGTAITGYLFTSIGTKITLCSYSLLTVILLVVFSIYVFGAKSPTGYTSMREDEGDQAELINPVNTVELLEEAS